MRERDGKSIVRGEIKIEENSVQLGPITVRFSQSFVSLVLAPREPVVRSVICGGVPAID